MFLKHLQDKSVPVVKTKKKKNAVAHVAEKLQKCSVLHFENFAMMQNLPINIP